MRSERKDKVDLDGHTLTKMRKKIGVRNFDDDHSREQTLITMTSHAHNNSMPILRDDD